MTFRDLLNLPLKEKLLAVLFTAGLWSFLFIGVLLWNIMIYILQSMS